MCCESYAHSSHAERTAAIARHVSTTTVKSDPELGDLPSQSFVPRPESVRLKSSAGAGNRPEIDGCR